MVARCGCVGCNNEGTVKIRTYHQINGFWLCDFHARRKEGYTYENTNYMNKSKKHGFTFGMELETNHSTLKARGVLVENGFIPTEDCTVNVEYKSSIHHGLSSFSQIYKSIDKLVEDGKLSFEDGLGSNYTCGTHFHLGHETYINRETMHYLRRFYNSLFFPLCEAMQANRTATERLFGRYFVHYASPITMRTEAMNHENFINLQHNYSIEFRLCKYQNAKQFTLLTHMLKEFGVAIVETYLSKYNDERMVINNKHYESEREYRITLARNTAKRLVNIFNKYAAKVAD